MPSDSVLTPVEDVSLKGSRYGLVILLAGALTMAGAAGFARNAFPFLLPDMRTALQSTYGHMGLLATVNNAGYVVSSLVGGILGARFGAKRVIFISMLLAGLFTFATGLSPGVEAALVFQFTTGLAAGGAIVPTVGVVAGWFEPRQRGVATGVMVGGLPLSILASSFFLPQVLLRLGADGWRYGWMVLGVLVLLLGVVVLATVREPPASLNPGGQGGGSQSALQPRLVEWGLLYRHRLLWHLAGINLFIGLAGGIFSTFFVAFLVAQRGLSAPEAGQVWGLVGLTGVASGIIWGYLSDVLGRRFGLASGNYVFFLALATLTFIQQPFAPYAAAVLAGLTLTGGMAVTVALLGDSLESWLAASAFGFVALFFNLGQVISPSLAGAIIDATGSFTSSLIAATAFGFMAATLCLFLQVKVPARAY